MHYFKQDLSAKEQNPRIVSLGDFRQRKSDDEIHAEMVKEDFQMVFFGHLASLLAPYCSLLTLFRKQTRFSPRPRLVAVLGKGFSVDFRFRSVSGGFRMINGAGFGLPRVLRLLMEAPWLPAPQVSLLDDLPKPAAERVWQEMVETLELREIKRAREDVSPDVAGHFEKWLDQIRVV